MQNKTKAIPIDFEAWYPDGRLQYNDEYKIMP